MTYSGALGFFTGDQPEDVIKFIHTATRTVLIFCSLLLTIFGIPGNIVAIKILQRRLMRENCLSPYLIWLAAMNICCLLIEMSRFLIMGLVDYNYREHSYEVCIVHRWATIVVITICNWFLVLITLSRWLLLRYPARAASLLKQTDVYVLIILAIFSLGFIQGFGLLLLFGFDFTGSPAARTHFRYNLCRIHAASFAFMVIRFFVGMIPLLFLAILSFLIFYQVKAGYREASLNLPLTTLNRRASRERSLAILLLISNMQFMFTNLPLAIFYTTAHKVFNDSSKLHMGLSELTANVALMSLYGGYATNCIIYCFFGSRFRTELTKFLFENGICRKYLRRASSYAAYGIQMRKLCSPPNEAYQAGSTLETLTTRAVDLDRADLESGTHKASCVHSTSEERYSYSRRSTCVDIVKYGSRTSTTSQRQGMSPSL